MNPLAFFSKNAKIEPNQIIIEGGQALELYRKTNESIHHIVIDEHQSLDVYSQLAPCYVCSREQMTKELGFRFHGGVLALAQKPKFSSLDQITFPVLYLNRVTGPENVGSLARLAAGLGFKSLVFDNETCDPYTRRCIRVSTGNIFTLNVCKNTSQDEFLGFSKNCDLVALELHERSVSLYDADWFCFEKLCLIVGGEGPGVHPDLLDLAKTILHVPQVDQFSSLNVSHAAAIAMSLRYSKVSP